MKASALYDTINTLAPFNTAEDWDNSGLLIGSPACESNRVLLTLDVTNATLEEAVFLGAKLIFSHHPVIFHPLKSLFSDSLHAGLIKNDITVICAHTNLDFAAGGINDALAQRLKLQNIRHFDMMTDTLSLGRIGALSSPTNPEDFALFVKTTLGCGGLSYVDGGKPITTVAVSGGHLSTTPAKALSLGCDALVSSEVKHSDFLDARDMGLTLIDAGHFPTEAVILPLLQQILSDKFPDTEFLLSAVKNPIHYI